MPSTWSATANNGLVTFRAFKDALDTLVIQPTNSFTVTDEVMTKADVENATRIDTANSLWTALSSNQCPTKEDIYKSAIYTALFWANKASSGNAGYDLTVVHKRGASTIQTKTATVNDTNCGSNQEKIIFIDTTGSTILKYDDVLELTVYYSGTASAIELKASTSSLADCGTENYSTCGENITINKRIYRSYQPKSYAACV